MLRYVLDCARWSTRLTHRLRWSLDHSKSCCRGALHRRRVLLSSDKRVRGSVLLPRSGQRDYCSNPSRTQLEPSVPSADSCSFSDVLAASQSRPTLLPAEATKPRRDLGLLSSSLRQGATDELDWLAPQTVPGAVPRPACL